mmetsp:Transcript_20450/g.37289  ORF Transcript_20450/g.37289 Transcript_20450/m.37289 type:complete len:207 (+) Transcript_20450:496-1116(+)
MLPLGACSAIPGGSAPLVVVDGVATPTLRDPGGAHALLAEAPPGGTRSLPERTCSLQEERFELAAAHSVELPTSRCCMMMLRSLLSTSCCSQPASGNCFSSSTQVVLLPKGLAAAGTPPSPNAAGARRCWLAAMSRSSDDVSRLIPHPSNALLDGLCGFLARRRGSLASAPKLACTLMSLTMLLEPFDMMSLPCTTALCEASGELE